MLSDLFKLPTSLPRALAYEDVLLLLEGGPRGNKKELRDQLLLELLYSSGLRVNELTSLDWEDVDMVERWLCVFGKGSKSRMVPFGQKARELLERWKLQNASQERCTQGASPLFEGVGGERLTDRTVHRVLFSSTRR